MNDKDKTKDELLAELELLRERLKNCVTGGSQSVLVAAESNIAGGYLASSRREDFKGTGDATPRDAIPRDAIEESEEKFRRMFKRHSAIMWLIDPETGLIVDANHAAEKFYGIPIEKLTGMKVEQVYGIPDEMVKKLMADALDDDGEDYFVFKHVRPGGYEKYIEVHSTPVEVGVGRLLFSIHHDITERVVYEKQLKEFTDYLGKKVMDEIEKRMAQEQILIHQSRLASMGEMLGIIAHQWRQPLTALRILVADLMDAYEHSEFSKEYLAGSSRDINSQIDFMSRTIDDFRDFFRPSKELERFDLAKAVDDVLNILSALLKSKSITVHVSRPDDRVETAGYPNEFKQVVLNVINNAVDAITGQRQKNLMDRAEGDIFIDIDRENGRPCVRIRDNGGGIPEEILGRIFEPYFTSKTKTAGTGIGLSMSKTIIEQNMHGTIRAENVNAGNATAADVTAGDMNVGDITVGAQFTIVL
jgi:PAS domain S-box-containing protein